MDARQSIVICISVAAILCSASIGAEVVNEPKLEWSFETEGKIYAPPVLSDLDNNGSVEVVVCASRDRRILCLSGEEGRLLWDFRIEEHDIDGLQATPSIIDYDGDGYKEIFFASRGGMVGCLDCQGRIIWRNYLWDTFDYGGPVVADMDGDGRIEVIVGSDSGTVYCLDDCGVKLWHYQGGGQIRGIPAIAREPESNTMRIFVVFGGGTEACLSSQGDVVWSHCEPGPRGERRSGSAVGDLDGDLKPEVITATEDFQVIVRDAFTGEEKWRWAGKAGIDQTNSFALAPICQQNHLDLVCADGTGQGGRGHVHLLSKGEAVWSVDVGGGVVQGPSIADVDGDGALEVLVCSRSRRLLCLAAADGAEEWSFPSDTEVLTTPAIGDVDGDGLTEIVFTSKDRRVYCITVDGAFDERTAPWPMISHDPQLTGNYGGAGFTPPAPGGGSLPLVYVPEYGPVHAGDNRISLQITNSFYRSRHLEAMATILLPNGRLINRMVTDRFEPGESRMLTVEFPALYEGNYSLWSCVYDVGQANELYVNERSGELEVDTPLNGEFLRMELGMPGLIDRFPPGEFLDRAKARLEPLSEAYEGAKARMVEAIKGEEATEQERREAVEAVQETGNALARFLARLHALCITLAESPPFGVVPDSTLRKVFKDQIFQTPYIAGQPVIKPAEISLCRNEAEGCQVVVVPVLDDLTNVRLSAAEGLTSSDGAKVIPAGDIAIHRVGYVETAPPEYGWDAGPQGWYPDVLFPNEPADIPATQDAQPYFITVTAGPDTAPGDYAGVIRVEADGHPAVEIPLQVHVWDFAIPEEPSMPVSMWMNEGFLKRFYGYEERTPWEVRKRFYDFHLEHRVSPIKDYPMGGGEMLEDFDYLMANGQNCFFVPIPHWLEEADRPAFAEKLLATREVLKSKGWDEDALFYSLDEVAVVQRHMIPKMVEMNTWIKTVLPEWPRLETSAPEQALFGAVDVWCPTIDHFDPSVLQQRIDEGERLWFYTVWGRPGLMIEMPAADHRLMFWACYRYGAEGFLYWGTTHWDLNCQGEERWPQRPWIPYNRQAGHNGCGYLIYPGPDGTPIGSIRFAAVRDGIEDYEYFALLQRLLDAVGDKAPEELRQRAEVEVGVPVDVFTDREKYTEEPYRILNARARIAGIIEEMSALAQGQSVSEGAAQTEPAGS